MFPIQFEGSRQIGKPKDMTDEQCSSIEAKNGVIPQPVVFYGIPTFHAVTDDQFPYWLTYWKPSFEDLQALNRGEGIWIRLLSNYMVPIAVFTLDEKNEINQ